MENNASLTHPVQASTIKRGDYLMINASPCKCIDVTTSKTGKHGGCKCHFIGVDIFTGAKHMMICSSTKYIPVPFVKKEDYELVNIEEDDEYVSLLAKNGSINDEVKIEDPGLKARILDAFTDNHCVVGGSRDFVLSDQVILCTVLSALGRSVVIDFKVQK
jgi:translation elongation factor IF5A